MADKPDPPGNQPPRELIRREPIKPPEHIAMDESRENVARRLGFTREHAEAYYRRGLQSFQDGDLENAILDLSEAIYYDRKHAEFYSTRGLFYLENNQEEEAELDLNYALTLNKRQWLAHYGLGLLDFKHGDYAVAVKQFDEALKHTPTRPEVWFYRGVAQHYAGDDVKAIADLERAEDLFPDGDKRLKDVSAWLKELRKNAPAAPKGATSAPPPLKRGPDQPRLEPPDNDS
jgi:Flp pilus assembly protein TadD